MAGIDIDVAAFAGVAQCCSPLPSEMLGAGIAAIKIVVGDDDVSGEGQAPLRHALETLRAFFRRPALAARVGPEVGVVEIGGGNEECSNDAVAFELIGGKHD